MTKKENIPTPLVLTHPVINSVHIIKLITEFNQVHVIIVIIINIQTQKVSVTYHLCFRVIHLMSFLNPFNGVETQREKINKLCVIKLHINNTGRVGNSKNNCSLKCYATNKTRKEKENYLVIKNRCRIN